MVPASDGEIPLTQSPSNQSMQSSKDAKRILVLEVSVIVSVYRQVFVLSSPFFIIPWTKRVGVWLV